MTEAIEFEQLAIQAGWMVRGGTWFNERFDGPKAADVQGADTYESAREVCDGERLHVAAES